MCLFSLGSYVNKLIVLIAHLNFFSKIQRVEMKSHFCCGKIKQAVRPKLTGKLLIAHPMIDEQALSKTIIFVEDSDERQMHGVILNRPLHVLMKDIGRQFDVPIVRTVPVYWGGEKCSNEVMLTAWVVNKQNNCYEIYHSLNGDSAIEIVKRYKNAQLRAYLGMCSFESSIYNDIENGLWIVSSAEQIIGANEHEEALWERLLLQTNPHALLI